MPQKYMLTGIARAPSKALEVNVHGQQEFLKLVLD